MIKECNWRGACKVESIETQEHSENPVVNPLTKGTFGNAVKLVFSKNLNFFFLKFNMICTFWIVLMC